jgi:mannose-6-phosphate isomerase
MTKLYPLLMTPVFDPRPWGTLDLSPIYPDQRFTEKIGEAWLTGDHCKVANGPLAGRRLDDLSREYQRALVGDAARDPQRFPLLLKFLFPHEKLSVQVHPDDEAAQRVGEPWGKTECWYIVHAAPGSQVGLGLQAGATREKLAQAIQEKRAEELLNWVDVHAGDMIYVAAGTVHTLGPGSILVETQQQSDATYRLYDYGRPRELHLERGLAAVKEKAASGKVLRRPAGSGAGKNGTARGEELVAAPYFVVDRYDLKMERAFTAAEEGSTSVQILVAVEGQGEVICQGSAPAPFAKGDAVVVPAEANDFSVRPQGRVEFLVSRVPATPRQEPIVQR